MKYNSIKKIYDTPLYHDCSVNGVWLASEGYMCWLEEDLLRQMGKPLFYTVQYVFFDTLPDENEVIRFRFGVELVDDKIVLRVEERGYVNDTIEEQMLKIYFEDRKRKIGNRQKGNFDVVIQDEMCNHEEFMLRYNFILENTEQAITLSKSIYKGVMSSVVNYFDL